MQQDGECIQARLLHEKQASTHCENKPSKKIVHVHISANYKLLCGAQSGLPQQGHSHTFYDFVITKL